jgi:predicted signal transduction protein with EAL and GGDEF domain
MPKSMMAEVSAIILERQLKDILTFPRHKRYSVNMENVFDYSAAWQKTMSAVVQYATRRTSLELMEDSMLCPNAMDDTGNACEETGAGIYLDDLCSLCHSLPDSQEYVVMLIQKLHKYIRAVKIDYSIMENVIIDLNAAREVANNLQSFRWLWVGNCNSPLPAVIFESMPKRDIKWLRELELLARGYKCCYYQTG